MLVGAYPFEDQEDPKNFRKTIQVSGFLLSLLYMSFDFVTLVLTFDSPYLCQRIMAVQYKIPDYVHISQDCRHLLSRIFVANAARVSIQGVDFIVSTSLCCKLLVHRGSLDVLFGTDYQSGLDFWISKFDFGY